jgi:ABC-type branched-subunit amino acid transport system substrate-binding protein
MRRLTPLIAVLLSLSLIAAACGDDESTTDDDAATTTAPDVTSAPDTSAPDDTNAPGDTTAPTTAPSEELTASARGITETTIRIGIAIPDVSRFSNSGDQVARYRVIADEINANGGVIGRQIDLVIVEWELLDTAGFDAACVKLTEDEDVFAIITRTPANFGDMTCLTDLGNTITINGLDLDSAEAEQSGGKLFSVLSDRFGALFGGIAQLSDELADAKVAITAADDAGGQARAGELEALLTDLGIEVVESTFSTISYSDDPAASLAEQDRFAEIWNSSGATHVIGIGNGVVGAAYAIDAQDLEDKMVLITPNLGVRTLNSLGADLAVLEIIGVAAPDPGSVAEQGLHGMPECIARVENELDETVIFFPEEEELNALPSTFQACASFDFLTAALEAVGPNPSQEDFVALTDAGFSFDMTGAATASVSADKFYMNDDAGTIYDWDGEAFTARG